ncbi:MAG: 1-acyl-sn-glycerol-3-phosphate acyltransferase [Candidatus Cloacimonetes bacterium]|nr:1-acyl-sn-glycerol-3-phosphate acyltransferase [Candidatus Cloacimonadota bacterium]MDD3579188.1 lysophospholipid acyltransferase family protein [Candidatus Cloacimonadota bacterium]
MKSTLWKIWFFFFMLLCMLGYFLLIVCKIILPRKLYRKVVFICVRFWGRNTLLSTGSTVQVEGVENLPDQNNICFIANHQGMFDIPLVLGFIKKPSGFIAKQELFKIPVLAWWMKEIPCVFIDRNSARAAMESFKKSAAVINDGHPMVIFPEGTRSKGDQMGEFHLGSFKLPVMAEATIVPLVIKDTWRIYEIDKGIHKVAIKLRILPPISAQDEIYQDKHRLSEYLHGLIQDTLTRM